MFSRRLLVFYSLLFLLVSPAAHSQFVHTQGTEIVDASGAPLQIRGISIGNWFVLEGYFWGFGGISQSQTDLEMVFTDLLGPTHSQEFLYNWRQNFMSKADVDRIKQDGFNTIRIPLHSKYFRTDDDEGFKLIDQLSKWCREDHIYIILMLESGIGGFTGEASDDGPGYPWLLMDVGMQKFVNEAWQRIANHYKDDPVILGYDLMNEPLLWRGYLPFENLIEPEYRRVTVAIREVDTHHMIILQPALGRFSEFGKPFDNNTVYSFHSYGADPNVHWLQQYLDYREKWQVPVFDDEIYAERTPDWEIAHVELAEKYKLGWMIWPYKKMAGYSSGPYTFPSPADWSKIVLFAHQAPDDRGVEDKNAVRPPQKDIDAMFADILENEKNEHLNVHPELLNLPGISAH
ncbi:MAG: cellulase family glycosylhydrolase [Terracidiphilus sp.]